MKYETVVFLLRMALVFLFGLLALAGLYALVIGLMSGS